MYTHRSSHRGSAVIAAGALLLMSCGETTEQVQQVDTMVKETQNRVQQVINELGLVYVEEGAQDIITYDEVNAAQQAW